MTAQDYDELARPLPSGRPPGMRIERVEAYREGPAQAAVRADRKAILSVLGFALAHADPFPMLLALAADLGGEQNLNRNGAGARAPLIAAGHSVVCAEFGNGGPTEGCAGCAGPPPTLPGPTEHTDMALRFAFWSGVFWVPDRDFANCGVMARPEHYRVFGLRVRIVYEHIREDRQAALDCAESWQARMMGAGAREVVVMGEEVER